MKDQQIHPVNPDKLSVIALTVVKRINPSTQDRDDLFQTAYMVGWESAHKAQSVGNAVSSYYLYKTMYRRAMTAYLATKKRQKREHKVDYDGDVWAAKDEGVGVEATDGIASVTSVDEADWVAIKREWLDQHLYLLSDEQRDAVELVHLCGVSLTKASELLKVSKRGLCNRLHRAVKKLKEALKQEGEA